MSSVVQGGVQDTECYEYRLNRSVEDPVLETLRDPYRFHPGDPKERGNNFTDSKVILVK